MNKPVFLVVQGEYGEGFVAVAAYYTRKAAVAHAERLKLESSFKWSDYALVMRIIPGEDITTVHEVSKR